jgi:hypothetical protein
MMKKTICTLLGLAMTLTVGQAAKIDRAHIVEDAKFMAHLDLDAFRASEMGKTILREIRKEGGVKLDAMVEIFGFDPFTAIHGATLSGNGEDEDAILVLKHKADNAKLLALMQLDDDYRKTEHGKHEIHGAGDRGGDGRGYVSFVNTKTAVLAGSRKLAVKGIDLVNGQESIKQIPADLRKIAKEAKTSFLIAHADLKSLKGQIDDDNLRQMVKKAALVLGESDGNLILSLAIDSYDADTAQQMEAMVNGLIGFARLGQDENPEIKDILNGLKVTRNEVNVSIRLSIGVDKIFEMIDPALKELDIDLPKP